MGRPVESDRWQRVEDLFEAAGRQPKDQRAEYLRKACSGDSDLLAEVVSLLKAAESANTLLDASPFPSTVERPAALKRGDQLGNFQIEELIGRGGMGEVYRARDVRLKRAVAIKTLPADFAGDRDRAARFEREARAASALNHPNIISVFDIGEDGGVSFIVSELVEGETLTRSILRGPLPVAEVIEVGTQLAEGLAAAHAAGVVHRDLKPGNIMLTRTGRVKILDFGLARQDPVPGFESGTTDVSHPGVILGTPGYMSPEQVRGTSVDHRSDLFSFGVVLYEMLCGKPAFEGASSADVMSAILKEDPPNLPHAACSAATNCTAVSGEGTQSPVPICVGRDSRVKWRPACTRPPAPASQTSASYRCRCRPFLGYCRRLAGFDAAARYSHNADHA